MNTRILLLLTSFIALTFPAQAETRTWTQAATGKTIVGKLHKVEGDRVRIIRESGVEVIVPTAMLAEDDRKYIVAWQTTSSAPTLPEGPVELALEDAHLCCGGCRTAVVKAGEGLEGVTITTEGSTIKIAAADAAKALEAVAAVHAAGYFGVPSIDAFADRTEYSSAKTASAELSGIHLCCGKCVSSAKDAIESVAGVTEVSGLERNASTVMVKGDFSPADLAQALHEAGFHAGGLN